MNRNIFIIAAVLALILVVGGISGCQKNGAITISRCANLTQTGATYVLTKSIINTTADCMNIMADNITLDCKGNKIDGDYPRAEDGIFIYNKSSNNIRNCIVTGFEYGIYLGHSSDNVITNNIASDNGEGIRIDRSSNNNIITNNKVKNNGWGIFFEYNSNNNIVTNNEVNNNDEQGIFSEYSSGNEIANNTANNNGNYGIHIYKGLNNRITNNVVKSNNKYGIYLLYSENNVVEANNFCTNNDSYDIYDAGANVFSDNYCNQGRKYVSGQATDCDNLCP
ncbi:MAG: NosD domain-containing protein [Candidatus Paceibacterota bacterium]